MVSHFICKKNLIRFLDCPAPMKSEQTGEQIDEMNINFKKVGRRCRVVCSSFRYLILSTGEQLDSLIPI